VNLGAQPVFIPAEGYADLDKLKEYECVLRRRVGVEWPWDMPSGGAIETLLADITATQAAFFGHAQTLREAIASSTIESLLREFSSGTTEARAALHLARAAVALGHPDQARRARTRPRRRYRDDTALAARAGLGVVAPRCPTIVAADELVGRPSTALWRLQLNAGTLGRPTHA
jgi:hypothetical protein